jgi:hypothetical protein
MRIQYKFSSNSSPKLKSKFHLNMIDLWSKIPKQKLWQILNSISMQNFTFFWGPKVFLLFLFSPADLFNWKKNLKWKNHRGLFSLRPAQLCTNPSKLPHAKPANTMCVPQSLTARTRLSTPTFPNPHPCSGRYPPPAWFRPNYNMSVRPRLPRATPSHPLTADWWLWAVPSPQLPILT